MLSAESPVLGDFPLPSAGHVTAGSGPVQWFTGLSLVQVMHGGDIASNTDPTSSRRRYSQPMPAKISETLLYCSADIFV